MLTIELPYPTRQLFPNTRSGSSRLQRAEVVRQARGLAKLVTLSGENGNLTDSRGETLPIRWTFHPPDHRRRDLDSALSACKPYQDGIADAMDVDDSTFRPVILDWGEPVKGGKVVVVIG